MRVKLKLGINALYLLSARILSDRKLLASKAVENYGYLISAKTLTPSGSIFLILYLYKIFPNLTI